jgi:secreted trypsin-like serine protease
MQRFSSAMRGLALALCTTATATATATACAGAADGSVSDGTTADAIIGGHADPNDAAVVALVEALGADEYTCTATFISTTVLLTAAHCVVDENHPKVIPSKATFRVMLAASRAAAKKSDWLPVRRANVHPHPRYDGDAEHDVAIVALDSPVAVTPIPIRRTPITSALVGSSVRLVGFGQSTRRSSANDGSDTRRTVTTTLRGLDGNLVRIGTTGHQACDGDSGGPALLAVDGVETLVATDDLSATDVNCAGGDLYQRVDLHLDFIDSYL